MNYRHVFHAGNFADCFKHALLIALIDAIARKPAPYFVLDTHAGAGRYDLDSADARRTLEADTGIRLLLQRPTPPLMRYLSLVDQLGLYPGSPLLIRAVLREGDRLACCETHPEDATALRRAFRHDRVAEIHHRSGWEALIALLPPREKRGIVFIDPPFEAQDEFFKLADGLRNAHARFANGVYAAWYPVKHMAMVRGFHATMSSSGIRDIIAVELHLRDISAPDGLNGCGMVVVNPPYRYEEQAGSIANALVGTFAHGQEGAGAAVIRLSNE